MFKLSHSSTYLTQNAWILSIRKVVLKILQARLQQYVNHELPMYKMDLEKAETREQIANILWIIDKEREFQKNIYLCIMTMPKS